MTKNYFQELAEEQGWKAVDNMAFGLQNDYPFSLEFDGSDGGTLFYTRFLVNGSTKAAAKALREEKLEQIEWHAENGQDEGTSILLGIASLPSDFFAKGTLHTLLEQSVRALKEAGLTPSTACPLCGLEGCDGHAYCNGGFRTVHKACLKSRLDLPEEDHRTPVRVKGHILTGILGALLGGFLSALPNAAQALNKGSVNSILYAFIPIMAILLYRLCRGKASKLTSTIIVLSASFVVAFCLEFVWYWFALSEQMGYGISFFESTQIFLSGRTFLSILHGMAFGLVFMCVGLIPTAVLIRGFAANGTTGGKKVRGTRFILSTSESPAPEDPAPFEKGAAP